MRRIAALVSVAAAVVLAALLTAGPAASEDRRYFAILDNAFGLVEGSDLRAAGVPIGKVEDLDVERRTARAVATIVVTDESFGRLREDVFCRVEPQSLIGEYFLNCEPGTATPLPPGATIPVEQTGTTVPADLVQNIMRRPYRERLGIILNEFGAAFGARGEELEAVIKRAIPALRETDRVLEILAENRREIQGATASGAVVLSALAERRDSLADFVEEAGDTAQASANRRGELARTFRIFPRFLRDLRPVLGELQTTTDRQTPALRDLRAASGDLETLFRRLGPFAEAARPALRSLGETSIRGRRAVELAEETIDLLRRVAETGEDPVSNLRYILEHLDNRSFAVEDYADIPDPGLTGLEAFLQYPWVQSQAINLFDVRGYTLKLNALINQCTPYADASVFREHPERAKACDAKLGPNEATRVPQQFGEPGTGQGDEPGPGDGDDGNPGPGGEPRSTTSDAAPEPQAPRPPSIELPGVGSIRAPSLPKAQLPKAQLPKAKVPSPGPGPSGAAEGALLDYLLGS